MLTDQPQRRKMVIVGDGACGKTCLVMTYLRGLYPSTYVPTCFENYVKDIQVDETTVVKMSMYDTAGQEDYDRLRPLGYPETNVVIIAFSVDSPISLENVSEKWFPEVKHFCEGVPIILVGCKTDLRDAQGPSGRRIVRRSEAEAVARKIKATEYLECSALTQEGVSVVFQTAARIALTHEPKKKKTKKRLCRIL